MSGPRVALDSFPNLDDDDLMTRNAPAEIDALTEWLHKRGYGVLEDEYSERDFGNWSRVFAGKSIRVLVIRERGEWDVEVGPVGRQRFFSLSVWRRCLGYEPRDSEPYSYQELAAFARESIPRMERRASDAGLRGCLEQTQRLAEAQALGLPLGPPVDDVLELRPNLGKDERRSAMARLAHRRNRRRRPMIDRDKGPRTDR